MKSLKSNEIYHNVAILIRWGRYALHEDIWPDDQISLNFESSSPGEFHPQALTESDMNLSIHPAPVSHFLETSQFQADEEGN